MATINDYGDTSDPLNAPPLGGPAGWAAAVRDAITDNGAAIVTAQGAADAAQADIDALGVWQSWAPTVSGATTSAVTARYTRVGDTIHFYVALTLSSTPDDVQVSVPVDSTGESVHLVRFTIAGIRYDGSGLTLSGLLYPRYSRASDHRQLPLAPTAPVQWAPGDRIYMTGTYEAA